MDKKLFYIVERGTNNRRFNRKDTPLITTKDGGEQKIKNLERWFTGYKYELITIEDYEKMYE